MENNNKTQRTVLMGLLIAMVCVGTMTVKIPVPVTSGYVNIGDAFIFVSAGFFGPIPGLIAGGIGSAMADILGGYPHFAIYTLIIKGLEGFVVGLLLKKGMSIYKNIGASLVGSFIMVGGYFLAESFMAGSFIAPLQSIPFNCFQGFFSIVLAMPIMSYGKLRSLAVKSHLTTER